MKTLILLAISCCVSAASDLSHVKILDDFRTVPLPVIEGIADCMVYELSCTPARDAYRAAYPEVMHNQCEYCSEKQKEAGYYFYDRLSKELPDKYRALRQKFDPDNKYYDNFYRVLERSVKNKV